MKNKKIGLFLLTILLLGMMTVGNVNAQTSVIQGSWELQSDRGRHVISFLDDTFVLLLNGNVNISGFYTFNPSSWLLNYPSNNRRYIGLVMGATDRGHAGLVYSFNANELVLSEMLLPRGISYPGFAMGRYRRIPEASEQGNRLIGGWRSDFINSENQNASELFRFFPNGNGVIFGFTDQILLDMPDIGDPAIINFKYEFTTPTTGQISILHPWTREVTGIYPFVIDGDILRLEGIQVEYRRR